MMRCKQCLRVVDRVGASTCPKCGGRLVEAMDPLVGRTVGRRFRILRRLGSGGMSTVYLAEDMLLGGRHAVKVLRQDLTRDPIQRGRFEREAQLVHRIQHDHIVEVTDYDDGSEGLFYLVMEYVPGVSLYREIRSGPFEALRTIDIARQVVGALARAHEMDVIHRDLKPENILLVRSPGDGPDASREVAKVLDFGIAKVTDFPTLTHSLQIIGTPGYIAPEYIQAHRIDGRADLYSLGVVLYEMVTGGHHPYDCRFTGDLLVKPITDAPKRPSERGVAVPGPLEDLVMRALARDPADRFPDGFAMEDALAEAAREIRLAGATGDAGHRPPSRPPPAVGAATPSPAPAGSSATTLTTPRPPRGEPAEPTAASYLPEPTATFASSDSPAPKRALPRVADEDRVQVPPNADANANGDEATAFDAATSAPRSLLGAEALLDGLRRDGVSGGSVAELEAAASGARAALRATLAIRARLRDVRRHGGRRIDELARVASERLRRMDDAAARRRALRDRDDPLDEREREELDRVERDVIRHQRRRTAVLRELDRVRMDLETRNASLETELAAALDSLEDRMTALADVMARW